jgi:hypothetical protein
MSSKKKQTGVKRKANKSGGDEDSSSSHKRQRRGGDDLFFFEDDDSSSSKAEKKVDAPVDEEEIQESVDEMKVRLAKQLLETTGLVRLSFLPSFLQLESILSFLFPLLFSCF